MMKHVVSLCRQLLFIAIILIPVNTVAKDCPDNIKAEIWITTADIPFEKKTLLLK